MNAALSFRDHDNDLEPESFGELCHFLNNILMIRWDRRWTLDSLLFIGKIEASGCYLACKFLVEVGLLFLVGAEVHFICLSGS